MQQSSNERTNSKICSMSGKYHRQRHTPLSQREWHSTCTKPETAPLCNNASCHHLLGFQLSLRHCAQAKSSYTCKPHPSIRLPSARIASSKRKKKKSAYAITCKYSLGYRLVYQAMPKTEGLDRQHLRSKPYASCTQSAWSHHMYIHRLYTVCMLERTEHVHACLTSACYVR